MLTTVPAPHRAIRRWTSGPGLGRGLTGFFPKYRHEKNSGMGFAHFQTRGSKDK